MSLRETLVVVACFGLFPMMPLAAQDIMTEFNTSDGFVTGDFNPVTLSSTTAPGFGAIFSLGQQQQGFDGGSYVNGPAGYLFINGTFNGVSGDGVDDDDGLIDFIGAGASEVTFFAANRAQGGFVGVDVFGVDDTTLLTSFQVTQTVLNASATQTVLSASALGGAIGRIEFDLPGPVANPPYVLAIDTFTATAVPEPGAAALFVLGMITMTSRRRRTS